MERKEYFEAIRDLPWEDVLSKFGLNIHYGPYGVAFGIIKCIVHHEEHPSLVLYRTGRWHCNGCGCSNDIFDFVETKLNSYNRAVRFFKRHFGIDPPRSSQS